LAKEKGQFILFTNFTRYFLILRKGGEEKDLKFSLIWQCYTKNLTEGGRRWGFQDRSIYGIKK
jgi:hypothetical protein